MTSNDLGANPFVFHHSSVQEAEQFRRDVSKRIAQARHAKGVSQNQLARQMGGPPYIEASQISRWERGLVFPSWRNFERLADALEVDIESFFHDS